MLFTFTTRRRIAAEAGGRRSARLGAPSGLARRMRASLVYLFTLKLANIHDIQRCIPLAEGAKPRPAALATCLKGTRPTAKAASSGRDRFLALYNQLRRDAGLEPTSPVF